MLTETAPGHMGRGFYSSENMYPPLLGDLEHRPHESVIAVLNSCAQRQKEALLTYDALSIDVQAGELLDGIQLYRSHVAGKHAEDARSAIATKYQEADWQQEDHSMFSHIAKRLAQFDEYRVVTDVDGTLTQNPSDYLTRLTPGSAIGEPMLQEHGREHFARVFVQVWQPLLSHVPWQFRQGGRRVPLREGVADFFQTQKEQGRTVEIISANFRPFVEGVLDQIPKAEGSTIYAVDADSIVATDKGTILTDIALSHPEKAIIYVGDGSSDEAALDARDIVACYFALEGNSFEKRLQEEGLPYFSYRTYSDISLQLAHLTDSVAQK